MDPSVIMEDYGLNDIQYRVESLFGYRIDMEHVLEQVLSGDVPGALWELVSGTINGVFRDVGDMKRVILWILIGGILAAVLTKLLDAFGKGQAGDVGYLFTFLFLTSLLLKTGNAAFEVAGDAVGTITSFVNLFAPAYFLAVGVAAGVATAAGGYQILVATVFIAEKVLQGVVLPVIRIYMVLTVCGGLWEEDRMSLMINGIEKITRVMLKVMLATVAGISTVQSLILPSADGIGNTLWQRTLTAIPGVGNAAEGVLDMLVGSAVLIKNGLGVTFLLLLIALAIPPLFKLAALAMMVRAIAALLGIIGDKRIVKETDRFGKAIFLLTRTAAISVMLFFTVVAIASLTTNRGY